MRWEPLQPFGATVALDLRGDVDEAQVAQLRQLFDTRHLLLFPGQSLAPEDQRRVAGWFGPVAPDKVASRYTTDPEMGDLGSGELAFHSDLSCTPEPLVGISLHAIDVDERSSPTLFVDAVAAAAALPEAMRTRLDGLHVMNLWPMQLAVRQRREAAPENWPGTAHPVLKPHPRTGEPILYLNASHSDRIVELSAGESESLIQELFARLYDPANRYEHRWRRGDLIVWDNLALQHARPPVPHGVARTLQRVEIGSRSYEELMPPELHAAYAQN
jgi:taurine dioxygenase